MKYVCVRHKPNQTATYWFEAEEKLAPYIRIGCEVICATRRGNNSGTVIAFLDGIEQDEAAKIIGNFFPPKRIIGVSMDVALADIHIPWEMEENSPSPDAIAEQVDAFYDNGSFRAPVIFTQDLNLHDGYAPYLVAKCLTMRHCMVFVRYCRR